MKRATVLFVLAMIAGPVLTRADEAAPRDDRRWVWVMTNLLVETEADRVVALIARAGRDGYNGLVVNDYKMNFLQRMPPHYFEHVARVRRAADRAGVELIPAVFPIGSSNGLLTNDVDLAEGLPVADVPFLVKGGAAVLVADPPVQVANGDLEETRGGGDVFTGFGYQDNPGKATCADDNFALWDQAARGVPGVRGFMYTTWRNGYGDLERYGKALLPR